MMSANNFGAYILAEGCVTYNIEGAQEHFSRSFLTRFEKV
jgi:hypothetical protein